MNKLPKLKNFHSISKYRLAQITIVFENKTDLYFAHQQINEHLQNMRERLPSNIELKIKPATTELSEIFMYVIKTKPNTHKTDNSTYNATNLRTIQDWIIRPQLRQVAKISEVDAIDDFIS